MVILTFQIVRRYPRSVDLFGWSGNKRRIKYGNEEVYVPQEHV